MFFSTKYKSEYRVVDLVHADLWRPYRFRTQDNCNMFLTVVEDKSRTTWVYLLFDKSRVVSLLKQFVKLVETQFHKTIKVLKTDNGTEFCNKDLKKKIAGAKHYTSNQLCIFSSTKWLGGKEA